MDEYSPKKLAQALVEKHDRLISEYSDETEKIRQITMLKEKKDQLKHWVEENGSKSKYSKELEDTTKELSQLSESFEEKGPGYYINLDEQIGQHRNAKKYWLEKISELKT